MTSTAFDAGLRPGSVSTDTAEFEEHLAALRRSTDPAERIRRGKSAVALYAGEFLPGNYDEWALSQQQRFRTLYGDALSTLATELETSGDLAAAAGVDSVRADGREVSGVISGSPDELLAVLARHRVEHLVMPDPDLADAFLGLYGAATEEPS